MVVLSVSSSAGQEEMMGEILVQYKVCIWSFPFPVISGPKLEIRRLDLVTSLLCNTYSVFCVCGHTCATKRVIIGCDVGALLTALGSRLMLLTS